MKQIILTMTIVLLCYVSVFAQKNPDSVLAFKMSLGKEYLHQSKTFKAVGYGMLAAGAAGVIISLTKEAHDQDAGGLFVASCVVMAISNPVLCQGSRRKGKAEILMAEGTPHLSNGPLDTKRKQYRSNATILSISGWVLFVGGFAGFIAGATSENSSNLILPATAMFASLPVWMNAAKNKGRLSVITGRDYITAPAPGVSANFRKIGIAFSLGGK